MFSSYSFIILSFPFKSLIPFNLIFVHGLKMAIFFDTIQNSVSVSFLKVICVVQIFATFHCLYIKIKLCGLSCSIHEFSYQCMIL
jgi:hypothetical protein